jgi:hypothetical protein
MHNQWGEGEVLFLVEGSFSGGGLYPSAEAYSVSVQCLVICLNLLYLIFFVTLAIYGMIDPDFTGEKFVH